MILISSWRQDSVALKLLLHPTALSSDESDEGETRASFSCHKCKYNDKSAAALLTHEKSMHTEGFTCQMCEFEPSGKDQLKEHIEEHKTINC